jgi:CRISPR system Cascade subunit CasA
VNDGFSFNLVDQPWIPCVMPDGTVRELGIHDVLEQAHLIAEIADPSPLITVSLHRLLLALIHRNVGPRDYDQWTALWQRGAWEMPVFDAYFDRWHDRFDLLAGEYPFYQWPGLGRDNAVPIAKLTHELASGNNATLFDHTTMSEARPFAPAEAARYVVAQQGFAVGGLVSYAKHEAPAQFKSADGGPLVRGATVVVRGASLFETLTLNLCQYDPATDRPFACRGRDLPAWEQPPPVTIVERAPSGYLEYLTWQSRRILLFPESDDAGCPVLRQAVIMKGNQFPTGFIRANCEVHQAFRKIEKPAAGQEPWVPVGFREDRALWRDSLALMQSLPEKDARPRILEWLDELAYEGFISRETTVPIDLLGLTADKAKVLFWRQERLSLSLQYLHDEQLQARVRDALELCESVAKGLNTATRKLVEFLLATSADQPGGRQPHKDDISGLADSLAPGRAYWPRLEVPFRALLLALPQDASPDSAGVIKYGGQALPIWEKAVRSAVNAAFAAITHGLDGSAKNLKAVANAERVLAIELAKVMGKVESAKEKGTS